MFDPNKLESAIVSIDAILLDPNNPRLIDLDPGAGRVTDSRVAEGGVQEHVFEQMLERSLDVRPLKRSIRQLGFLRMDKIVVRPIDADQFVVVEGNRRVAAVKSLLRDHETGRDTLSDELVEQLHDMEVLILRAPATEAVTDQWLLQGLRHISGVKAWGPYQRAKALEALVEQMGYNLADAAEAVGLGPVKARRALESLSALEQMGEDVAYGEAAAPDMYSYFEEVIKRPVLRDWLGWRPMEDSRDSGFDNTERVELFYSWIVGTDEEDRKIKRAIELRELAKVVAHEDALQEMTRSDGTLVRALAMAMEVEPAAWERDVTRAIEALERLPSNVLESLTTEQEELVRSLVSTAQLRLHQAEILEDSVANGQETPPGQPPAHVEPDDLDD